jgi:hypothetical protein
MEILYLMFPDNSKTSTIRNSSLVYELQEWNFKAKAAMVLKKTSEELKIQSLKDLYA